MSAPSPLARLLPRLFRGGQAFVGVESILAGLSEAQAGTRPPGLPHSPAELLAHINYWLAWMLEVIESGEARPYPHSAAEGWPKPLGWAAEKARFYDLLSRTEPHALRPDLMSPVNFDETIGELLADFALHTAHHLGQLITVRQALGAWPPPGGGDTW